MKQKLWVEREITCVLCQNRLGWFLFFFGKEIKNGNGFSIEMWVWSFGGFSPQQTHSCP